MQYEFRKVDSGNTTKAQIDTLEAQGWEAVAPLEDKTSEKGKVLVKKSHIIRFRRPVQSSSDDVVLSPDDVTKRFKFK